MKVKVQLFFCQKKYLEELLKIDKLLLHKIPHSVLHWAVFCFKMIILIALVCAEQNYPPMKANIGLKLGRLLYR